MGTGPPPADGRTRARGHLVAFEVLAVATARRNEVWQMIRALAAAGTTVLLTTQHLEEADQLADAITMIAAGRSSPRAPRTS